MIGNTEIPEDSEVKLEDPIERQVEEEEQIIGIYGNMGDEGESVNCIRRSHQFTLRSV